MPLSDTFRRIWRPQGELFHRSVRINLRVVSWRRDAAAQPCCAARLRRGDKVERLGELLPITDLAPWWRHQTLHAGVAAHCSGLRPPSLPSVRNLSWREDLIILNILGCWAGFRPCVSNVIFTKWRNKLGQGMVSALLTVGFAGGCK